jgi:Protein of unknown function (DUF3455)
MKPRWALLFFFLASLASAGGSEDNGPKIPDNLKIPEGNVLLFKTQAEGVQLYVSEEVDGKLIWKFKAPLAFLSQDGKKMGYHYAGPTWEAGDGSKVQIDKSQEPAKAKPADPKRDVPWLRIKVKPTGGIKGKFSPVTYILRLETEGGVAPSVKAARAGMEVGIPYKATYYFFGPRKET